MHGVSARKVDALVKGLGMEGISRSQVSRVCAELDAEVEQFRSRPLCGPYPDDVAIVRLVGMILSEQHRVRAKWVGQVSRGYFSAESLGKLDKPEGGRGDRRGRVGAPTRAQPPIFRRVPFHRPFRL
jgi:hypothetical protein